MKTFISLGSLMLLALLACSLALAASGSPHRPAAVDSPAVKRLEGTWVGDGEGTMAWMRQSGKFQPAYIESMRVFLGTVAATYRADGTVIIRSGNSAPREVLWRIVREDGDRLEIQSVVAPAQGAAVNWNNALLSVIEFEDKGNALWVSRPTDPTGLRERFVKEANSNGEAGLSAR